MALLDVFGGAGKSVVLPMILPSFPSLEGEGRCGQASCRLEDGYRANTIYLEHHLRLTISRVHTMPIIGSAENSTAAFKEVAIIRHPRVGEYAFAFITSTVTLQVGFSVFRAVGHF